MQTAQEAFWAGDFGNDYWQRNSQIDWPARIPFLRSILDRTGARSVLDAGTNAGWNLRALRVIDGTLNLMGIDRNQQALIAAANAGLHVADCSLIGLEDFTARFDLVVHSGVLIHVSPADLERSMRAIMGVSNRYVLAVEYNAPNPQEEVGARLSLDATGKIAYMAIAPERVAILRKDGVCPVPSDPDPNATPYAKVDLEADKVLAVEYYTADGEEGIPYRGQFHCLWKRPFGDLYHRLGMKLVASGASTPGYDDCAWWLLSK